MDATTLLPALADVMGVEQSRLALLSVNAIDEARCQVTVRITRTAASEKLPSFMAAEQVITTWDDPTVFDSAFPLTVDADTPPSYVILDTSDNKKSSSDNAPWWKDDKIQAGVAAVVALLIIGAVISFFVKRRRRARQDSPAATTRDSAIYTYRSSPAFLRADNTRKPGFQDSGL